MHEGEAREEEEREAEEWEEEEREEEEREEEEKEGEERRGQSFMSGTSWRRLEMKKVREASRVFSHDPA